MIQFFVGILVMLTYVLIFTIGYATGERYVLLDCTNYGAYKTTTVDMKCEVKK